MELLGDQALSDLGLDSVKDNIGTPAAFPGLKSAVYRDYVSGKYILSFAGTDMTTLKDWIQNAMQGVGLDAELMSESISPGERRLPTAATLPVHIASQSHTHGQQSINHTAIELSKEVPEGHLRTEFGASQQGDIDVIDQPELLAEESHYRVVDNAEFKISQNYLVLIDEDEANDEVFIQKKLPKRSFQTDHESDDAFVLFEMVVTHLSNGVAD